MIIRGKLQRKQLVTRIILLFLLILPVLIIIGLTGELVNRHKVSDKISALEQQMSQTQSENLEINTLVSNWESGSQLEKEARSKLGMKKEGERVVLITKDSSSAPLLPPAPLDPDVLNPAKKQDNNPAGNPLKWWQYFFK
jgi:cell division protein FtsB